MREWEGVEREWGGREGVGRVLGRREGGECAWCRRRLTVWGKDGG